LQIVETMSYNENVAEFLGSLGSFYEAVPQEDLQMAVGDIIEKVSSRGSSPAHSTASPSRQQNLSQTPVVDEEDDEDDDFKDSLVFNFHSIFLMGNILNIFFLSFLGQTGRR